MPKRINMHGILQVLYENQGQLYDPSEVADHFNMNGNNYDEKAAIIMETLEEKGLINKDMREPFIGYEISVAGIRYLLLKSRNSTSYGEY